MSASVAPTATEYDTILNDILTINPAFDTTEADEQKFLNSIITTIDSITDAQFASLSPETAAWFNESADNLKEGKPIPAPEGMYDAGTAPAAAPVAAAPAHVAAPAAASKRGEGLARYREQQKALKAQQAAAAPVAAAPAPASRTAAPARQAAPVAAPPAAPVNVVPMRRAAPGVAAPVAPVAAAPVRRSAPVAAAPAPAPAPAPARRAAPAPVSAAPAAPAEPKQRRASIGRHPDQAEDLRWQVIWNPAISAEELVAYAQANGYQQAETSVRAVVSTVRNVLSLLERNGRLRTKEEVEAAGFPY